VLIENGLPDDFIAQFLAAATVLEKVEGRAT
jgi:hypothetical protein